MVHIAGTCFQFLWHEMTQSITTAMNRILILIQSWSPAEASRETESHDATEAQK